MSLHLREIAALLRLGLRKERRFAAERCEGGADLPTADRLELTWETYVLLESIPAHAVLRSQVTAHNALGESAPSAVVSLPLASRMTAELFR